MAKVKAPARLPKLGRSVCVELAKQGHTAVSLATFEGVAKVLEELSVLRHVALFVAQNLDDKAVAQPPSETLTRALALDWQPETCHGCRGRSR